MKSNTDLLRPSTFYHVYNRGINGENLFKSEKNYAQFLKKYAHHVAPVADTYAYCLLKNHFHLLIETKSQKEIEAYSSAQYPTKIIDSVDHFIGKQFGHLFNGYAQLINKANKRTGGLFETPFRRIEVDNDAYFSHMIWYIHSNPQKHGFVDDFRDYPHSSYHSHLASTATKLKRDEVLGWFGNKENYVHFHSKQHDENGIRHLTIEVDCMERSEVTFQDSFL
jgi:REP element-mobilizing transposase RayT